jgi:hypothetical protein
MEWIENGTNPSLASDPLTMSTITRLKQSNDNRTKAISKRENPLRPLSSSVDPRFMLTP